MYKKIVSVEFNSVWLLEHRGDFDEYPVQYLAKSIEKELSDVKVQHTSDSLRCVLNTTEEMPKETAGELVATFIMDKFGLESLRGIAEISVEDPPSPEEEKERGFDIHDLFQGLGLFSDDDDEEGEEDEDEEDDEEDGEDDEDDEEDEEDEDDEDDEEDKEDEEKDEDSGKYDIARRFEEMRRRLHAAARRFTDDDEDEDEKEPREKESIRLPDLLNKIGDIRTRLNEKIKGQTRAVEEFLTNLFSMETNALKERHSPRALYLFAGPPGVGKTYLAETAAEILDLPFLRLDMSAYSDDEVSVVSFRGIAPSYKASAPGIVTKFVHENPRCVLLFDEIEKAHANVIQLFLQILEGGRCRDFYMEEEISFTDTIIIMTTNAGRNLYEGTGKTNFASVSPAMILNALATDIDPATKRPFFPAAVLSRIAEGSVVMFNHLDPTALRSIVRATLDDAAENIHKRFGIAVSYEKRVEDAVLFEAGASDARSLKKHARSLLENELMALVELIRKEDRAEALGKLESVRFTVDLDGITGDAKPLFLPEKQPKVLLFAADGAALAAGCAARGIDVVYSADLNEAKALLRGEADIVVADILCGCRDRAYAPGDPEDIDSDGNEFFRYVREFYDELPVYMLDRRGAGEEAFRSYIRRGSSGVLACAEGEEAFAAALSAGCESAVTLMQQNALQRVHKVLSYNCAQVFSADGKEAEIKLASLCLKRDVGVEDSLLVLEDTMRPAVRFKDVIGAEEAKEALRWYIDYMKNPRAYLNKGTRAPRGILLYGPPGTGKTLLAKAMAGESGVTFIQKNATEFFEKYVGEGPKAIRKAFAVARKYAPAVLFIDEVDTIAKPRTGSEFSHSSEELLNTFLSEMDGFVFDEKRPVLVMAATNFAVEGGQDARRVLDAAFVRRFDRRIEVGLPNTEERRQFIEYYLGKHGIETIGKGTVKNVALRTIGRSPADLENLIEFAIRRAKGAPLTGKMLEQALDAERYGKEKAWSPETVRKTSLHEAGHVVIQWLTGSVPEYVTNISRGGYGGYVLSKVDEEKFDYTRAELQDKICSALGGRAAEVAFYGREGGMTTGASSDLRAATRAAEDIVLRYGMDESNLLSFETYPDGALGDAMRARVGEIVKEQAQRASALIEANRETAEALAELLIRKNSLTSDELRKFFQGREKNLL